MNEDQKFVLEKNLTRFDSYINATNTKSAFIVSFNVFIAGAILFEYDDILKSYQKVWTSNLVVILFFICIIAVTFAVVKSFRVVTPFLKTGVPDGESDTLLFFMSVAKMNKDTYVRRISDLERSGVYKDLINQTYILAKGAESKFTNIKHSIYATMVVISALILSALLRLIDSI